jgi:arginine-tRNA-protein transferase
MNYKGQYAPSFLLDPVTYDWFPIEECKKELDKKPFVSFKTPDAMYTLKVPPGWLEPSQINDTDLENIFLMIDESTALPFSAIINRIPKKSKTLLIDYVCSVGLALASNILVS